VLQKEKWDGDRIEKREARSRAHFPQERDLVRKRLARDKYADQRDCEQF
jgi:hypothetical protein